MRTKLTVFFVFFAAAIALLVVTSSGASAQVHLKLHEFQAELNKSDGDKIAARQLTLYGKVKEGTILREGTKARFVLVDGSHELIIEHSGKNLLPDTFQDGADAGVEGHYNALQKTFTSDKVMAKCASRYESVAKAAK